jgi:hypothetical protein
MMPIITQKTLRIEYARSFFMTEHHASMTASIVLKVHTNMNGLAGPSQLTKLKLETRIKTPTSSIAPTFFAE